MQPDSGVGAPLGHVNWSHLLPIPARSSCYHSRVEGEGCRASHARSVACSDTEREEGKAREGIECEERKGVRRVMQERKWDAEARPCCRSDALVLPASFHRGSLKRDTPKYPNYTCTSCPFVAGILLFFPPSLHPESLPTQSGQLSSEQQRRPAQTSMSVPLEAGGSDVLLMALIGRCVSLQLWKYLIHISLSLRVNFWCLLCDSDAIQNIRELRVKN